MKTEQILKAVKRLSWIRTRDVGIMINGDAFVNVVTWVECIIISSLLFKPKEIIYFRRPQRLVKTVSKQRLV